MSKLMVMDTPEIRAMLGKNEVSFKALGDRKTIYFVVCSDYDRSLDGLANLFFQQCLDGLCRYADSCPGEHLPIPVRFILDDFATNVTIPDFSCILSNIRSRKISATLVCQSPKQLEAMYGTDARIIMEDCDTTVLLGCNDVETAREFAQRANRPVREILEMPVGHAYLFIHGRAPQLIETIDLDEYINTNGIDIGSDDKTL